MGPIIPGSILIVQIGKIGDMILTTPLFTGLKKLYPSSVLNVLCSNSNKEIPLNHDAVNDVIVYDKSLRSVITILKKLYGKSDLWIDTKTEFSRTSDYLVKHLKPKFSLGFNFAKKVFDIDLKSYVMCSHAVCINNSALNYLSGKNDNGLSMPHYNIPENVTAKFKDLFGKENYLNLVINVSAGNKNRYFSKSKWLEIIKSLSDCGKFRICLTGIAEDSELTGFLVEKFSGKNVTYVSTKNIMEISEVIKKSDIVLTPDTAVVHICSAFNKPVAAVYPEVKWNLDKFKPLSDLHEIIISKSKDNLEEASTPEIIEKVIRISESLR